MAVQEVVPDAAAAVVTPSTGNATTGNATTGNATTGNATGKPDEVKAQLGKCTELATQNNWQALDDCASVLASLGAREKATEFHDKAIRETQNERKKDELLRAIKDVNLKAAQTAQKDIGEDSVYFRSAHDAYVKAENQAVEQARRAAQNFVNAHDCIGIRRYYNQLKDSNTERVAQVVGTLVGRCSVQTQAQADPGAAKAPPPPTNTAPPPPPAASKPACEGAEVEELINQAKRQYGDGYARTALTQMQKALACRQDIKMYQMAAMYACAAHDVNAAKLYFKQIPPAQQAPIEQRCQQEHLDVRGQ